MIDIVKNKKVLVLGLAKSGESAARLLDKLGAIVTVNDGKPFEENPTAQSLLEDGIRVICGSHPLELLDEDFALMVKIQEFAMIILWLKKQLEKEFQYGQRLNWPTWYQMLQSWGLQVRTARQRQRP